MFGGAGLYPDGLCFAVASRGEVHVKAEAESEAAFAAAASEPFVCEMQGKPRARGFWRLVAEADDDPEALRRFAELGRAASRRAAAAKAARRPSARRAKRAKSR